VVLGFFSDQAMKPIIAPFSGKICFTESLPGLFVRTPQGNIVYLLKHKQPDSQKLLLKLVSSDHKHDRENSLGSERAAQKSFEVWLNDIQSGSLLWVKNGEFVESGQLLVQASRLKTTSQEMPESTHPVHSPISGEIFFLNQWLFELSKKKNV